MILAFALIGMGLLALAHTAPAPGPIDWLAGSRAVWEMPRQPPGAAPRVYLTFDDGPNPAATPSLLDVLRRERVAATFFLIDDHITPETRPIVARMAAEGHDVAVHSNQRRLMFLPADQFVRRLDEAAGRIGSAAGGPVCRAFRPHAGFRSGAMYEGLARRDYRLVGWGWNLWDWNWFRRRQSATIVPRLLSHVSDGDIIVIHDGHHRNPRADRRDAIETVARLVPALRARQFTFGTICELSRSSTVAPH